MGGGGDRLNPDEICTCGSHRRIQVFTPPLQVSVLFQAMEHFVRRANRSVINMVV